MPDPIHFALDRPEISDDMRRATAELLAYAPLRRGGSARAHSDAFWSLVRSKLPDWMAYEERWTRSRLPGATAIEDALPWVTFPAIDFLDKWLNEKHRVFEWGSGGSTVFFGVRAGEVVSVEHDPAWFEKVAPILAAKNLPTKLTQRLIEPAPTNAVDPAYASGARGWESASFEAYVRAIEPYDDASFDLVVVDGRARMGCLAAAAAKVAPGGLLLIDNANYPRYQGPLKQLRSRVLRRWIEIDLSGPGPYSMTPCWQTVVWQRPADDQGGFRADDTEAGTPLSELRDALARQVLRPYDRISYWPIQMEREEVERAIDGQPFEALGISFSFADEIEHEAIGENRSKVLFQHSWDPFDAILAYFSDTHDERVIDFVCERIGHWIDRFGSVPLDRSADDTSAHRPSFVSADTAISNRFYRLAYVICAAAPRQRIGDRLFEKMVRSLLVHAGALSLDANFSLHSNHGVQQALGQLCGSSRFLEIEQSGATVLPIGMIAAFEQGNRRLLATLKDHVAADGIHKEHSVWYHVLLTRAFDWISTSGVIADAEVLAIVRKMRAAGTWMFDSNGRIANLGDTDLEPRLPFADMFLDKPAGPDTTSAAFPDGGYWFVKGGGKGGIYLAQTACFHSRVHKQADTGSFIWRDHGLDILIDAGRFGYSGRTQKGDALFRDGFWYSDARRIHVETTAAHNTMSVDGGNHPRVGSRPFGSGIVATTERNGVFASETSISNLPGLTHSRIVAVRPHRWLLCVDTVRANDLSSRVIAQHFNLHPDWVLDHSANDTAVFSHGSGTRLHMRCIFNGARIEEIARGKGSPETDDPEELVGWWSPRSMTFEPCNAVRIAARGRLVTIATLFSFSEVEFSRSLTSYNWTRRRFRFRWRDHLGAQELQLRRGVDESGKPALMIL